MLNLAKLLNRLKWSTFKAEGRWDVDDQGLTPHRTFLLLAQQAAWQSHRKQGSMGQIEKPWIDKELISVLDRN